MEREIQMYPSHYNPLYQLLCLSITISIALPCILCSSQDYPQYANCTQPFKCGNTKILGDLKFPFWGINRAKYCGRPGYEIKCLGNTPFITISASNLRVIGTNPEAHKITVAMAMFWNNLCPSVVFTNTSIDYSISGLDSISPYLDSNIVLVTILYGCPSNLSHQFSWSGQYSCSINNSKIDVHFVTHTPVVKLSSSECKGVAVLPILKESEQALDDNTTTLPEALNKGFDLGFDSFWTNTCYTCVESGGQCGYNHLTQTGFTCYCPDKPYLLECVRSKQGNVRKKMILLAAYLAAATGGIVMLGFIVFFSKQILQKCKPVLQDQSVEDCLKNYTSLDPSRYTYANVKRMTNSFKQKLGEGGYGEVFKGTLYDGRDVAVKVWKQSKGDGQDFVNEVMSISRTSHVNIVPLLGFCFEGKRRALVYEFMPNGSLEKFTNGRGLNENNQPLSIQKLHEIAIGIAKGLEYLHQGCNTRIVHFDIKPHNILLDAEFTPKISDFGLAKPFKKKESIMSMSEARGTIGYIAPEVFFRGFGGVSHKSDVYSYGMMVLEMAGCTKREDENAENSSELYFPRWIYKKLEQESALNSGWILNNENELKRKMILVGLWCIQTNPLNRPPMSRVVDMLEGEMQLLQVPPMPSFFSPPRQQQSTEDGYNALLS